MTYPAFLFLGCFLIEGFKSRHTFLGPTTMDNDLTLAKNPTIDFLIPSQIKKLIEQQTDVKSQQIYTVRF